ncbi:MAG: CsgG/HfaB family protein [bacterium]
MRILKISIVLFSLFLLSCATSRFQEAEQLVQNREYRQALRAYITMLQPHMRDGRRYIYYDEEIYTRIGALFWYMGRYESASKILRLVLNKNSDYGKALFYLGMINESMDNKQRALEVYKSYYKLDKGDYYRTAMLSRLDFIVKQMMNVQIQEAIRNEKSISLENFPDKSLAVLYFTNLSDNPRWRPLQKGLAEMMITDLSQIEELMVVERIRLNYLMDELRLGVSGISEEENISRVGKLLGAKNLIKGSYMITPTDEVLLDANIYRLSVDLMPQSASYEGTISELFRLEKELVLKVINYFNIRLTPEKRSEIFEIPTEDMEAFINYCMGLEAMDRGDMVTAQKYFQKALYIDKDFQEAKDKLISPRIWEATHSENRIRVATEVDNYAEEMAKREVKDLYVRPQMVSAMNRLRWMAGKQNAEFIPDEEFRRSFVEAERVLSLLPEELGTPPPPPGN